MTNSSQSREQHAYPASAILLGARERRREPRRPITGKATLTIIDGPGAGSAYCVQTRDLSLSGISFLLKDPLGVGQLCRIDMQNGGILASHLCEVVRSRPLSNGRYEMGVKFRKSL